MPRSLGMTLYALRQPRDAALPPQRPARPAGRLLWMVAPTEGATRGIVFLARRLVEEDGLSVLVSAPAAFPHRDGVIPDAAPPDTQPEVGDFLDHWKPEVIVFSQGELRPVLIEEAVARKIPVLMVDGHHPHFPRGKEGWFPGLMRSTLARFHHVAAVDEAAARAFRKGGALLSRVSVSGRLEEESAALPCLEAERAALAQALATRPIWFAVGLPESEETAVIEVHREALRLAHRLLLIVAPLDPDRAGPLAEKIEEKTGWITACRARDEEPDRETEVYVVDSAAEYGLWYRLAPITFLGGTLYGAGASRNPLEAAALGSAILHGARLGPHGMIFARLAAARATRLVASAQDLSDGLGDLLAPDRTARLAQAAWTVASDGAEVTERITDMIRRAMDGPE